MAQLVGAVDALICLVAGNMIGVFLASLPLSFACQRNGLEQIDVCKPAFGPKGITVVLLLYLINMLGWSGLILVMFGNGIRNIALALGYEAGPWVVSVGVLSSVTEVPSVVEVTWVPALPAVSAKSIVKATAPSVSPDARVNAAVQLLATVDIWVDLGSIAPERIEELKAVSGWSWDART